MGTDTKKPLMTRRQMVEHLNQNGFPLAVSTVEKMCAPLVGGGPKVAKWFGKKPLYSGDDAVEWARGLLTDKPSKLPYPHNGKENTAA